MHKRTVRATNDEDPPATKMRKTIPAVPDDGETESALSDESETAGMTPELRVSSYDKAVQDREGLLLSARGRTTHGRDHDNWKRRKSDSAGWRYSLVL